MTENIFKRAVFISDTELLKEKLKNADKLKVLVDFNFDTVNFHLGHWIILSKIKELSKEGAEIVFVLNDFILGTGDTQINKGILTDKLKRIIFSENFSVLSCREVLKNKETKDPFPYEQTVGAKLCFAMREEGVMTRPLGDVIVLMPPIAIDIGLLEKLVEVIKNAIENKLPKIVEKL